MDSPLHDELLPTILQDLLGYLNYSSGAADPQFLRNLNELYRRIESAGVERDDAAQISSTLLSARLAELQVTAPAFRDVEQAQAVLALVFEHFLPAYREHHRDLLFHQTDAALWRPLFLGRVFEAVLAQGSPWDEPDRITAAAIEELNDFLGHRPVAVLRTAQRVEPYEHEWIRPVPLFVRGAGVAVGRYRAILEQALDILAKTAPEILTQAHFDLQLLDELALDPRAYDFDHPVNKRPNYHFGQWDPHHLDNQGRYRRFVVQQVTLDALLERVDHSHEGAREELLFEAAAVLAGTILMASGSSGSGPDTYDSTVTLATLLPRIAAYRDSYYQGLLASAGGKRGDRLREEAKVGRQPLAGARQHLNHYLARRRASQLEHVHLALLMARMGYADEARRQASVAPVAAARMRCEIQCRVTAGRLAIQRGSLRGAAELVEECEDFLRRAIQCGALADPWNILGFQGQFSLFPSPENSVPDYRIDQLIELMEQIFNLYAQLWSEAAAQDDGQLQKSLDAGMSELAHWWDEFASTTVDSIDSFSGAAAYNSARQVASALKAWHRGGAAAGDIAFWREHAQSFHAPKAYALVVEALLEKHDYLSAMALLVQWLGEADKIALKEGEYSFHSLARRWLNRLCRRQQSDEAGGAKTSPALVRKFFDYLEANAEDFWQAPQLVTDAAPRARGEREPSDEDDPDDEDPDGEDPDVFGAAYDEMVYVDSTGDGVEADMLESGSGPTDYELEIEARRLRERLAFLGTLARLWKQAALNCQTVVNGQPADAALMRDLGPHWLEQVEHNIQGLLELLSAVERQRIADPSASRESLLEYERRRNIKEALLENIITTAVETADAARFLRASAEQLPADDIGTEVLRAALRGDAESARRLWPDFLVKLRVESLLYVPISKAGDPRKIVAARCIQQTIRDLLRWLPRLGLFGEACSLIAAARDMETQHPVGAGAVSEFDRLFEMGFKSIVESIVAVSRDWPRVTADAVAAAEEADNQLVDCLEGYTETLLKQWLTHSRTLRLSALEKVGDEKSWQPLVKFIEQYGHDLFTQRFLNQGNLRAILHQGVDAWMARLEEDPDSRDELPLLADVGGKLPRPQAIKYLTLVIEAIVENYAEYRDYNSTTTQSDRGELLYMLLDFLRVRVQYDRIAWQLRPVLMAHEILVRQGRAGAAALWRQTLAERTHEVADNLQARIAELRKQYGMRLPTVSDRIAERFVRTLAIDRMRALVQPAIDELHCGRPSVSFALLKSEAEELMQEPTGVGLDVPPWLQSLEQEVEQARQAGLHGAGAEDMPLAIPQVPLTLDEVLRQLTEWDDETQE